MGETSLTTEEYDIGSQAKKNFSPLLLCLTAESYYQKTNSDSFGRIGPLAINFREPSEIDLVQSAEKVTIRTLVSSHTQLGWYSPLIHRIWRAG